MSSNSVCRLIEFMRLVGRLKNTVRTGWKLREVSEPESVADHMYRMAVMSFLVEPTSGLDKNKCIKMSLVHDLAECIVGDITPQCGVSKDVKSQREKDAMEYITSLINSSVRSEILALFEEFEEQKTKEALFVKDLDRFDMILQAHDYEVEANRRDGWLQEFFDSTEGKFSSDQVQEWVQELKSLRNQHLCTSTKEDQNS